MFQAQNQFAGTQLPVPYDAILDQSTLNQNLPQGNDQVPPVQLSPWMSQNQQIGLFAIALFRSMAQSSLNKSQVHCAGYNLLTQNRFQNNIWTQYGQMVVDMTEFLIRARNYTPEDAVKMAAQRVMETFLSDVYVTYPILQQVTDQATQIKLQGAMNIAQSVKRDIQAFKSGGMGAQQMSNQLPQINTTGYHQPSYHQPAPQFNNGVSHLQTSTYTPSFQQQAPQQIQGATGGTNSVDNAFYDDPAPVRPLRPVEEVSTETLDYYDNSFTQGTTPMQTFTQNAVEQNFQQPQVEPEQTDLPVPMSVNDVVIDPTYYVPTGHKLNLQRPYDKFFNPGGIEIRPAHLALDWTLSIGDDMPWHQLVDPDRFCLFLVKFPDGAVKEKPFEWNPSMQYLRHELDVELRRKAQRPNGIVVASSTPISTIGGDAATEADVHTLVKDGHLKRSAVPPVILETVFSGATDLEIEMTVREELQNLLEVEFNEDIPMPAVEYRSTYMHPLNITKEAFDQLTMLSKQEELGQIALGLRELATQGILPLRYFRFINDRFTKAINNVLRDGLVLTTQIDDFCEDYFDLEAHITKKKGESFVAALRGATRSIINKSMFLMVASELTGEGEDEQVMVYQIADNFINFQLGWSLDDLSALNIREGKPVLISASAHPTILETLKGVIKRANENEEFVVGTMRLITSEGYYLEVIKGLLIQKATLLKLVK